MKIKKNSVQSEILSRHLEKKKRENPRLSLRGVAKRLKISASLLSMILHGTRKVPLPLLDALVSILDIDQEDRDRLLHSVLALDQPLAGAQELSSPSKRTKVRWDQLDKREAQWIADWSDVAILDATSLKSYDGSPEFIARELFLDLGLVNKKMTALKEVGFLVEKNGIWKKSKKSLQAGSRNDFTFIRKYHAAHLDHAKWLLENKTNPEDLSRRLITGMTFTLSTRSVTKLRNKIHEFLLEVAEEYAGDDPEELYQIAFQLFPLNR